MSLEILAKLLGQVVPFDPLTGLPNRKRLRDRLRQAIRLARRIRQSSVGILFIDLDHFKAINDTYGHAVGDAVLIEIAARLRACLRESDMIARLGGDEFVALLGHLRNSEDTVIVAERILNACTRPIIVAEQVCQISASLGLAVWPFDGETVDELLQNADRAMYASKDEGRNTLRFYDRNMKWRNAMAQRRFPIEQACGWIS